MYFRTKSVVFFARRPLNCFDKVPIFSDDLCSSQVVFELIIDLFLEEMGLTHPPKGKHLPRPPFVIKRKGTEIKSQGGGWQMIV